MSRHSLMLALSLSSFVFPLAAAEPLPDTKPLIEDGDLAAKMVAGIDKYLMRELDRSSEQWEDDWKAKHPSVNAYLKAAAPKRERLKKLIGAVDERVPFADLEFVGGPNTPPMLAETNDYKVFAVRWPVLPGVDGEGLLLEPKGKVVACVVALPDADWTPEMLIGLSPGVPKESQFARRLAENGCRVIVPVLIDRKDTWSGNPKVGRMTNQPHREFLYRMAYEVGRHIIGYEVQKVEAAVDWFCREDVHPPVGVFGYGEGALVGYFAAEIDTRIAAVCVTGYSFPTELAWKTPVYRNVWGLFPEFDNSNLATVVNMIGPRAIILGSGEDPKVGGPPAPRAGRSGAAPGVLPPEGVLVFTGTHPLGFKAILLDEKKDANQFVEGTRVLIETMTRAKAGSGSLRPDGPPPGETRKDFDPDARQHRQFDQLVAFTQNVLRDSERDRDKTFWSKVDTSSVENYRASTKLFREQLDEEVIGKLPAATEPMNPRTRLLYDEPKYRAYEVVLDIYPDVFAYGILALPKDLKPGEKRPVVVCQHGRSGRPTDVINPKEDTKIYHSFGSRLAERGYIVYAPQNPYIFEEKFRVLQRKANPLGLSLFSFIVRQHATTLDWLTTLPNVDPDRIAFYGLSYGGKTAMRVPALEPRYCLSICSGDFNDCVAKNASIDYPCSFLFTLEYEMPEFNLGHTFNYAEMAALIAPRPFMVERGHDDGVATDEVVAAEYAKVRRLYARLKIPERTEIEFFDGGHEIHADGTFRFLKKHLKWPQEAK